MRLVGELAAPGGSSQRPASQPPSLPDGWVVGCHGTLNGPDGAPPPAPAAATCRRRAACGRRRRCWPRCASGSPPACRSCCCWGTATCSTRSTPRPWASTFTPTGGGGRERVSERMSDLKSTEALGEYWHAYRWEVAAPGWARGCHAVACVGRAGLPLCMRCQPGRCKQLHTGVEPATCPPA